MAKEIHETDYQRARRQRLEMKKHGITGATPADAAKRIKKHELSKKMKDGFDSNKRWGNSALKGHGVNSPAMMEDRKKKKMAGKIKPYDHVGALIAHESGELDDAGTKQLFQHLVDTGQAWHLQGHYGRTADAMLEAGYIKKPKHGGKGQTDAYGNKMKDYYKKK